MDGSPPVAGPLASSSRADSPPSRSSASAQEGETARRAVIYLSPRTSPTPEPPAAAGTGPATPIVRLLSASPPPVGDTPSGMQSRSLLRLIAATGSAPDASLLSPDLYYDAAGRLRATTSNTRLRRAATLSPGVSPALRQRDADAPSDDEAADNEALFVTSLRAGDSVRRRRGLARVGVGAVAGAGMPAVDGADEIVSDTGWFQLGATPPTELDISPEERRAARERWTSDSYPFTASPELDDEVAGDGWTVQQREVDSAFDAAREQLEAMERGETGSIWRNEPHSISRTVTIPRGGHSLRPLSTFGPANPPPSRSARLARPAESGPRRSLFDLDEQAMYDQWRAELQGEPARAPPDGRRRAPAVLDSDNDSSGSENDEADGQAAAAEELRAQMRAEQDEEFYVRTRTSLRRRRTRDETNAMMGATLRSKKGVALLYCGGSGSGAESDRGRLPRGFSWAGDGGAQTGGCGALVCARALVDGVPAKVFHDRGREEPAASSDLPPRADRVGDWGEDGGDRTGMRGWTGCKGCSTRDFGCKRCGNHLGYRLLLPCVTCSISRPSYTSYASAVSSAHPQPLVLSAGGVTGGGVVDRLLFHYRLEAVTPLPRLIGRVPADELDAEERARARSGEGGEDDAEDEEDAEVRGGRRIGVPAVRRLREKRPRDGGRMYWKAIPSAQRDFQEGLVGEPVDWIDPKGQTWWLDVAIAKHVRKRTASEAWGDSGTSGARDGFDPDRLSSATTTVAGANTAPSSSPSGTTLSRSHAIRLRVPLSGSSSSTSAGAAGASPSTADPDNLGRRVRRRIADPSAADGQVAGSLERAGYGSGFELEREVEETSWTREGARREAVGR